MADTDDKACEERYNDLRKTIRWGIKILGGIGLGLAAIGGMAWSAGYDAQNGLDQHTARQNGTLEAIQVQFESIQGQIETTQAQFESVNSQLGSLRTYHSTLRGEMKTRNEQLKDQRAILDELLLRSRPTP